MRALWLADRPAAVERAAPLAAAIVAACHERFGVGPTWRELCLKLGVPPMASAFPLRGSPEWDSWNDAISEFIPEMGSMGWLAASPNASQTIEAGPRWKADGASWLQKQSTVPNIRAYYFRHAPEAADVEQGITKSLPDFQPEPTIVSIDSSDAQRDSASGD